MAACSGSAALAEVLRAPDPGAAFLDAGLMAQRSIIDALCVVKLKKGIRHSKEFDSDTVDIIPRTFAR